jgi:membrane protease subunit HflK
MRRWVRIALAVAGFIALVLYLASGFYSLKPTEQALVLRFGELVRVTGRKDERLLGGLHYRLPWPFERELIAQVHQEFTTSVGFRFIDRERGQGPLPFEVEWLTADRNLVDIQMVANFFIKDQEDYHFGCRDHRWFMIRWVAEAALTEILGQMQIDDVFAQRNRVALAVRKRTQELLDSYDAGVELTAVSPEKIDAPLRVWSAFNRANQAKAEIDKRIREARQKEYKLLESARADSRKMIDAAEAEREAVLADARGRTQAFMALEEQYRETPEGTRQRLVQETLREILSRVQVIQAGTESSIQIFVEP